MSSVPPSKSFDELVTEGLTRIEEIWNSQCPDIIKDSFECYINLSHIFGKDNFPPMLKDAHTCRSFWEAISTRMPEGFVLKSGGRDAGYGRNISYTVKNNPT